MNQIKGITSCFSNPRKCDDMSVYPDDLKQILDIDKALQVIEDISVWPEYHQTPMYSLDGLAKTIGVKKVWYKDESSRFGLGSFKALGGAYAVAKQIIIQLKKIQSGTVSMQSLLSGQYKDKIKHITVSCATDGNHGRSVAWGAKLFGCQCVIYLHSHVSIGREKVIASYGAKVVRIDGNYDDSVKLAAEDAKTYNRVIVSDTSYPGYMEIPKDIALGYCVMLHEITLQLSGELPTHILIQGGVGGLASAVCGYFWQYWKAACPKFIIIEPEKANCLQLSAINGKPTTVTGDLETLMAGLACGEVSSLAWDILDLAVDDFVTIDEVSIVPAMKFLAKNNDINIQAGESAVAGVALLMSDFERNKFIKQLQLTASSKVLVFGTEGATDPELYEELTGIKVNVDDKAFV
jgi:diaminopropionate ammonia-lyase